MTVVVSAPVAVPEHPAKFSKPVLDVLVAQTYREGERGRDLLDSPESLPPRLTVLDPFAGVGLIHRLADEDGLNVETIGVELEPEWARAHPRTIVGDALRLPFADASIDVVATSPCYGNRMADQHEAKDPCRACGGKGFLEDEPDPVKGYATCRACRGEGLSRRNTYRHRLGRPLSIGSGAGLQWGKAYREFHGAAWREVARVVKPGGLVLLNVSNFIRDGREMPVVEWHVHCWITLGAQLVAAKRVRTQRNRQGANGEARVDGEVVVLLRPGVVQW